jgi:hypothetical protein
MTTPNGYCQYADLRSGSCRRDPEDEADSDVPLLTMGSLSVARELMRASMASADLELVDRRTLDGRVLLVEYRPTGKDIPRA